MKKMIMKVHQQFPILCGSEKKTENTEEIDTSNDTEIKNELINKSSDI